MTNRVEEMPIPGKRLASNKSDSDIRGSYGQATSTAWRRERLMNIGVSSSPPGMNESMSLSNSTPNFAAYGTMPLPQRSKNGKQHRKSHPPLPAISTAPVLHSNPESPLWSPVNETSIFRRTKTISTYDPPPSAFKADEAGFLQDSRFSDTKLNGIRVWYSSFSSVDWLHDAIKESSRLWRIRSRKSLRGKLISALDRSVDWITVTIVGFLTAMIAFFIVRSEQWLFDLKEGRCQQGWWNAKRFCPQWQTWADALGVDGDERSPDTMFGSGSWAVEYVVYAIIAVRCTISDLHSSLLIRYWRDTQLCLATISSLLTINLTASPSFISNKDSGVLAPEFGAGDKPLRAEELPGQKRKVLYFVSRFLLFVVLGE